MIILILVAFVVLSLTIDAVIQYNKKKKLKVANSSLHQARMFNETSISIPKGLYFDKTHTWAFMEKNGEVKIGIDDFLLHITGPLNHVKLRNSGDKILKGEGFLSIIQNGKQLILNSPISGTIISQNTKLIDDSSSIKISPFNEGWIYMIEPTNWLRETQFLLMSDKYKEWLKNEFTRLKDFFALLGQSKNIEYATIVLQDGGELKDNILEDLAPEIWEEFQTKFINTSI